MIQRTEPEAGTFQKSIAISRRDHASRSGTMPIQQGSFIVYNALNHHKASPKIADLETLCDIAPVGDAGEGSLLGRLSRGAGTLRRWLSRGHDEHLAGFQPEPLDDHTLSDIGIPRIETLYWDPNKSNH